MSRHDRHVNASPLISFRKLVTLVAAFVFAMNIAAAPCQAPQDKSTPRYGVPTRGLRVHGGFVNLVEGEVERIRAGTLNQTLKPRTAIENGDAIAAGHTGRTEILLTPGYYLRLGNDTRATFLDLTPGNLKIKILNGSAIVEVSITDARLYSKRSIYDVVTVATPCDEYALATGGAYRFDVNADGASNLKVLKGLAIVSGSSVKNGMFASVLRGRVELAAADKKSDDLFDKWSRDRAASLIHGNKSLKRAKWFKQPPETRADVVAEDPEHARQSNEARTVSARSGFVVLAESGTMIKRGESAWERLTPGDSVNTGDRVVTPIDCRVDIHPRPDVDLLLAGDTEVIYTESEDGNLSVEVLKGSAIIVPQFERASRAQSTITLIAHKTQFEISKSGVYRVNVVPARASSVLVYEGEGRFAGRDVKASKKITLLDSGSSVVTFNKSAQDSFDVWADKRSQSLSVRGRREDLSSYGGIWFVIESIGEFTFVPAVLDYQSPYGGDYSVTYLTVAMPFGNSGGRRSDEFPSAPVLPQNPKSPRTSPSPPPPNPPR